MSATRRAWAWLDAHLPDRETEPATRWFADVCLLAGLEVAAALAVIWWWALFDMSENVGVAWLFTFVAVGIPTGVVWWLAMEASNAEVQDSKKDQQHDVLPGKEEA